MSPADISRYFDALGSRWWFLGLFFVSSAERILYVGTGVRELGHGRAVHDGCYHMHAQEMKDNLSRRRCWGRGCRSGSCLRVYQ